MISYSTSQRVLLIPTNSFTLQRIRYNLVEFGFFISGMDSDSIPTLRAVITGTFLSFEWRLSHDYYYCQGIGFNGAVNKFMRCAQGFLPFNEYTASH